MNIFFTDYDPYIAANNLDDKRVGKMLIESCQMLSTALNLSGVHDDLLYKPAYINHPCTRWARETRKNFEWLATHAAGLADVYRHRFGYDHKSSTVADICWSYSWALDVDEYTPIPNCSLYKNEQDIIKAYRKTMVCKWRIKDSKPVTFTGCTKPDWYHTYLPDIQREYGISLDIGD